MSLDPRKLEVGDRVIFFNRAAKIVATTSSEFFDDIWFKGGMRLKCDDELWEQAKLVKPKLPYMLTFCYMGNEGHYDINGYDYTPEKVLKFLKQDVAALEAAGVKEEEE